MAKSLERIHTANLINFGILPLTFKNESDYDRIAQGDELEIPNIREHPPGAASTLVVKNKTKGTAVSNGRSYSLSGAARRATPPGRGHAGL